jgi:hypothetical protein
MILNNVNIFSESSKIKKKTSQFNLSYIGHLNCIHTITSLPYGYSGDSWSHLHDLDCRTFHHYCY